jgi:hypothetical protein
MPAGVIGLLMLPLAVTSRTFGDDWTVHLWLVRQQEMNIQANGRPGLFLSARPVGAFYPIFAFVGSGVYSVGGYLAILLGDRPIVAYKLLYLGALCLAYGGMTWLSRQVGLPGWRSQIPGLVYVTGTYFVTDMFARGDLGEFVAIAAIPFLIAALTAATISSRLHAEHLLGVVLGVFVFTGSHNITLLYGTIFLALLALVLLGAYRLSGLARLPWRRLPAVFAAGAIGVGLNAWYLLPDLKYSLSTAVARSNLDQAAPWSAGLSQWRVLLDPLPSPSHGWGHDFRLSLPTLFAAWAIVVAVVAWRRIDPVARRLIVVLTGLAGLYLSIVTFSTPWKAFPHFLYNIQFTWRLLSYVLLTTALLVMAVLAGQARANQPMRRATNAALTIIAIFTVSAATWQAWTVRSTYHENGQTLPAPSNFADIVVADRYVLPPSWYADGQFRDVSGQVIDVGFAPQLIVPEAHVRGSTFSERLYVRAGPLPFRTNIAAGPHLVQITGIKPLGITASGFVVAERVPGTPQTGPVDVTIRQAHTTLLRVGAFVSMFSLAALAALLAWPVLAWLRPRLAPVPLPRRDASDPDERDSMDRSLAPPPPRRRTSGSVA